MNSTNRLAPLSEEPVSEEDGGCCGTGRNISGVSSSPRKQSWKNWLKTQLLSLVINPSTKTSDLRILLSVLGCPLFPLPVKPHLPHSNPDGLPVSSSAEYIVQQFAAATGCRKLDGAVKNVFTTGKVRMSVVEELAGLAADRASHRGCFVMWEMVPDNKWLIELVVGGHKVVAGSDGKVAWRHTPWLGSHVAKGGLRPLRRSLQGLDPMAISAVFRMAQSVGEKQIRGVDCFVLKLSADGAALARRTDNTWETIKHVVLGYFSQRDGLLIHLEDSCLTRIQHPGVHPTYWETTIGSKVVDYRAVEGSGVLMAHAGHSVATITRFGDDLKAGPEVTRMEEAWTIDDIAFNVPGLSPDSFLPPEDVREVFPLDSCVTWTFPNLLA